MSRLKNIILVMLIAVGSIYALPLKLQVSSTKIPKGQSVKVKIIAEGSNVEFPNITDIEGVAVENLYKGTKMESRLVNGKFTVSYQKYISFVLFPNKTITIPPLNVTIDGTKYATKPVTIEVVSNNSASNTATNSAMGGFSIKMISSKKSMHVSEPFILTVKVYEPINGTVSRIEYRPPEFKDFFSKSLGGEKQIREGNSIVHIIKYLLVPQKAGSLVISPAQTKIGVQDMNAPADPFGIFGTALKWYTVRSEALKLDVKPLPSGVDLVGDYKISAKVDTKVTEANKPVNYILTIKGRGSLEDIEDPSFKIPGVTVYSDEAKVDTKLVSGRLISTYVKKFVFISDRSFTIPSLKFKEFNYLNDKLVTLQTPQIDIEVKGGSSISQPIATQGSQTLKSTQKPLLVQKPKSESIFEDSEFYAQKELKREKNKEYLYLAIAFVLGIIFCWIVRYILKSFGFGKKSKRLKHYSNEEALKILYPHINEDSEAERIVQLLYEAKRGKKVAVDRKIIDKIVAKYDK